MMRHGALLPLLLLTSPADATYSIVAADPSSAASGISIASCVGSLDLDIAYGTAPGFGSVAAQASVDSQFRGRTRAVELLRLGELPAEILDEITTTAVDPSPASRQYGVAAVQHLSLDGAGSYTGSSTGGWSGGTRGRVDGAEGLRYAAQGNILTGPECVAQSVDGFLAAWVPANRGSRHSANATMAAVLKQEEECGDIAARLMRGLLAAGDNDEGDSRCTNRNPPVPADSALIRVDLADGTPWLLLSVTNSYPLNAVDVLYVEYLLWRLEHPCGEIPEPPSDAAAAAASAAAGRAKSKAHSAKALQLLQDYMAAHDGAAPVI